MRVQDSGAADAQVRVAVCAGVPVVRRRLDAKCYRIRCGSRVGRLSWSGFRMHACVLYLPSCVSFVRGVRGCSVSNRGACVTNVCVYGSYSDADIWLHAGNAR